jgi:5-methylcytosine-specific restriction endonuclease McrA
MKTYSDKLKDPRWQKKRLEILERDSFTCKMCKDKETELHIHHLKYGFDNPWENDNEDLVTCCKFCHQIQTSLNKENYNVIEVIKNDIFYAALCYDSNNKKSSSLYYTDNNSLISIMQYGEDTFKKINDIFSKSYYFFNQ